jgi:hypothetical protein
MARKREEKTNFSEMPKRVSRVMPDSPSFCSCVYSARSGELISKAACTFFLLE